MRALLCLVIAVLSAAALGQDVQPVPPSNPPPATQQDGVQDVPVQVKPTEPRGFPGLPQRNGPLPLPQPPGESDNKLHILQAGSINRVGNIVTLGGGAKVQYRGYDIIAQEIVGDLDKQIFDTQGDVHVQGRDAVITGDRVRINYVDNTYRAWDTNAQIQPALLAGQLLDPLYSKSKLSFGSQREIFTFDSDFTTCNYLDPHFYVAAK
jgi:lipopolysaccharide assembly outer membrane protein LptD (OstA)